MQVQIKLLSDAAKIPTYSRIGDAGLDLTAISIKQVETPEYGYVEYGTGLAIKIPDGYVGLIFPRSSISNYGMILSNSVGVVDSGYLGEIKFRFKYIKGSNAYNIGDRVGQLIIIPYPTIEFEQVEELPETNRGEAGFGSTNTVENG